MRRDLLAFLLSLPLLVGTQLALPCRAQSASGLEGKELAPASNLDVQALVGALLGDDTSGALHKIVVTEDRERRLTVEVSYQDLPDRRLEGELRGPDRKVQPIFGRPTAALGAGSGTALLIFEPGAGFPEGSEVESASLRLRVIRSGLPVAEIERSFTLGKRWRLSVAPENIVVHLTPRPEGAAAELREKEAGIALPPVRPLPTRNVGTKAEAVGARRGATRPQTRSMTPAPAAAPAGRYAGALTTEQGVLKKAGPAVSALPASSRLVLVKSFAFGLDKGITDKQGKGPGETVLDLLEGLRADVSLPREAISRVSARVFQDQNPSSGIFYFLPASYALDWAPVSGYGMRMLYGAAQEGEAAEVLMAARLDAGVDTAEVELATALLRAYHARHPSVKFSELRPLPIEQPPAVSLAAELQQRYEIPPERIAISSISDALGQVEVSWSTDTVTKENVQLALVEEVGLDGSLVFTPSGGGLPPQSVAIRLRLADPDTFGRMVWRRGEPWRNAMPYPVRLKYLHALIFEGNAPVVFSWSLDDATVPPQGRAEFDAHSIPSWLDDRAAQMWLDYAPVADCAACDQEVIATITGGVTSFGASAITVHTITPLADLGAYEISITVRSRYFDPRSRQEQTKPPLALNADNKDFSVGPIFLGDRQSGQPVPNDPLFSYWLEMAMPDGTTHRASRWIAADSLRLLIGKFQVEQALGALPPALDLQ